MEELLDNIKEAKYVPIDDPEVADEIRVILASTMRVDYNERPGILISRFSLSLCCSFCVCVCVVLSLSLSRFVFLPLSLCFYV